MCTHRYKSDEGDEGCPVSGGADFMNICYWHTHITACEARGWREWKENSSFIVTFTCICVYLLICKLKYTHIDTHGLVLKGKIYSSPIAQGLQKKIVSKKLNNLRTLKTWKLFSFPCNTHYPHSFLPTAFESMFFIVLNFYEAQFSFVLKSKTESGQRVGAKSLLKTSKTPKLKNNLSRNTFD